MEWPDLWIHPEDSFVLTIKAAELVASNQHSAGFTLRFPRILKMRIDIAGKVGDEKPVHLCETISSLKQTYLDRKNVEKTKKATGGECRFKTAKERDKEKQRKKREEKVRSGEARSEATKC